MHTQTEKTRTIAEMTVAGASAREIAEKVDSTERTVRRHRAAAKTPGAPGRPQKRGELADAIVAMARAGMAQKAIAAQLCLAAVTVAKIAREAGFFFPRGGDRRSAAARAAQREAPGGLWDKRINVDTAASWAHSAYASGGRLTAECRGQKELPRSLRKVINLAQV